MISILQGTKDRLCSKDLNLSETKRRQDKLENPGEEGKRGNRVILSKNEIQYAVLALANRIFVFQNKSWQNRNIYQKFAFITITCVHLTLSRAIAQS